MSKKLSLAYYDILTRILLFVLAFALGKPSTAAQDFTIKKFDVKIEVKKEGYIQVNEIIHIDFPVPRHGIYREIPYRHTLEGKKYSTPITKISVKGHPFKTTTEGGYKIIRIGDANVTVHGAQIYEIDYSVKGPFITAGTYDEFYWNITGNAWKDPIEKVHFDIALPDDTRLNYDDIKVFTGATGSKMDSAYVLQSGQHITGHSIASLRPGEGLTISLRLPLGYIDPANTVDIHATKAQAFKKELKTQWPLAIIPAVLISLLVGFWNRLRRPKVNAPIEDTTPYPPDHMNPAEVGGFYDHVVNDRDVISLLPYWAAQGHIRMEYDQNSQDTYLTKLSNLDGDRAIYEHTLFNQLFSGRTSVNLSTLRDHFHTTHSTVKNMIHDEIIGKQLYDSEYRYWVKSWRPWLVLFGLITLGVIALMMGYWLTALFFVLGFIIGIILIAQPKVLSERGEDLHRRLQAFYHFLKGDNPTSLQSIVAKDPLYFDKVYPYAIALKLDKSFISKIKPYHPQAPIWYGYYGMVGMGHTMESFGQEFQPKEIHSAFSSVPQPINGGSSGSKSSGGGLSGGGFGGGGGGSW